MSSTRLPASSVEHKENVFVWLLSCTLEGKSQFFRSLLNEEPNKKQHINLEQVKKANKKKEKQSNLYAIKKRTVSSNIEALDCEASDVRYSQRIAAHGEPRGGLNGKQQN